MLFATVAPKGELGYTTPVSTDTSTLIKSHTLIMLMKQANRSQVPAHATANSEHEASLSFRCRFTRSYEQEYSEEVRPLSMENPPTGCALLFILTFNFSCAF